MVLITDYFSKASSDTDRATATTVKTIRNAGETVLSCFDLGSYSTDTIVCFITYKKVTDPVTGATSVINQTSWVGIVDADNNTITDLTIAPGYTDIGNEVGDFVECIPTSEWSNRLIKGILQFANPNGTLKTIGTDLVESSSIKNNAVIPTKWTNPYKFSAYPSATVAISSTSQKVALNTELFDTNNNFDTSNNRYTAPVTGYYHIDAQAMFSSGGYGAGEWFGLVLKKNGTTIADTGRTNGSGDINQIPTAHISGLFKLDAGQYIEIFVNTGGVYREIMAGPNVTFMTGHLVSLT